MQKSIYQNIAAAKQRLPPQVPIAVIVHPSGDKQLNCKNALSESQPGYQIEAKGSKPQSANAFHVGIIGTKHKAIVAKISGPFFFNPSPFLSFLL